MLISHVCMANYMELMLLNETWGTSILRINITVQQMHGRGGINVLMEQPCGASVDKVDMKVLKAFSFLLPDYIFQCRWVK